MRNSHDCCSNGYERLWSAVTAVVNIRAEAGIEPAPEGRIGGVGERSVVEPQWQLGHNFLRTTSEAKLRRGLNRRSQASSVQLEWVGSRVGGCGARVSSGPFF